MGSAPKDHWPKRLTASADQSEIEHFYAWLTLGDFEGEGQSLLEAVMQSCGASEQLRRHLRQQDPARLLVYRELTRATHRRVLLGAIPRAIARMEEQFATFFTNFLAQRATESHRLRDITQDFLEHSRTSPQAKELPRYIWELAELEAVRIVVAAAPDVRVNADRDLDLNSSLVFAESSQLLAFEYAVHLLPEDEGDRSAPIERATFLLSYRSEENRVKYLELSPSAFEIIRRLREGMSLGRAVTTACEDLGRPVTDDVLAGTAQLLSDLANKTVVVGIKGPLPKAD